MNRDIFFQQHHDADIIELTEGGLPIRAIYFDLKNKHIPVCMFEYTELTREDAEKIWLSLEQMRPKTDQ